MRDRYKIYIIDEAHMVTTQGFNALLKIVEEPPEHVRFIFATTEPEKVIGTVRSRTHHYPFRLIPPRVLSAYLGELCEREGVAIEPAALPLVVRAGGGSARDTLSVLDQLIGGAGRGRRHLRPHRRRCSASPPTPCSTRSSTRSPRTTAPRVFGVVDKVIEVGQDPRRFTEDLLQRLRDLLIIAAVPDASASGLIDVPEDQAERLVAQAARFGQPRAVAAPPTWSPRGSPSSRAPPLRGCCSSCSAPGCCCPAPTTAPAGWRPASTGSRSGWRSAPPRRAPAGRRRPPQPADAGAGSCSRSRQPRPATGSRTRRRRRRRPRPAEPPPAAAAPSRPSEPAADPRAAAAGGRPPLRPQPRRAAEPAAAQPTPPRRPAAGAAPARVRRADARRRAPAVARGRRGGEGQARVTWIQLSQHAQVVGLDGRTLTLGVQQPRRPRVVRQRPQRRDPPAGPHRPRRPGVEDRRDRRPVGPARHRAAGPGDQPAVQPDAVRRRARSRRTPAAPGQPHRRADRRSRRARGRPAGPGRPSGTRQPARRRRPARRRARGAQAARRACRETRAARARRATAAPGDLPTRTPHRDDPDAEEQLDGPSCSASGSGAQIIEEIPHN